ncbi:MAG: holo-[acyl-carrier-protein] synthase [Elusimicrobia bacterium GWA2_56_46]|nr:MAG: holo-[acyl-carrier-protein] synthase [Elusimicrobia bacterium GWA2_56_46]OGR54346.1 MAG: holo-[acyl-carrier-protein] synthase [Elusimicrobia bacterium GWC2_56_31]HBB65718.1 holo-[acyl-carrier-protein] synthase [Elusimicrobiota bacterium]HBW22803.1 holo-[acyl-carrier-protein] synthase [Elusimicrobiota bacterium]
MKKHSAAAVCGIGVDITEVARIRRLYEKNPAFLKRFFTREEIAYCLKGRNIYERIAARFSAKEAVIKALDRKDLPLKAIAVSKTGTGRPAVALKGPGLGGISVMLSLSHTENYACASAVAFKV